MYIFGVYIHVYMYICIYIYCGDEVNPCGDEVTLYFSSFLSRNTEMKPMA